MVNMNRLATERRVAVVKALVEGCSIRATVRLTGVAKNTVTKLLVELGAACSAYQNEHLRNLSCKRLQLDEIWHCLSLTARSVAPILRP
jgi:transposase